MGYFDGIEEAQYGQGGVFFLQGVYPRVRIEKVKMFESRKKKDLFIVECTILESQVKDRPADMKCSWIVNMEHDAALGNIKGFVAAANGIDPEKEPKRVNEEVTSAAVEYVVSDDQPLTGTEIKLTATNILTRAKTDFTLHRWEPV